MKQGIRSSLRCAWLLFPILAVGCGGAEQGKSEVGAQGGSEAFGDPLGGGSGGGVVAGPGLQGGASGRDPNGSMNVETKGGSNPQTEHGTTPPLDGITLEPTPDGGLGDPNRYGGHLDPGAACVADKQQAERRQLDLYFMLDKTGSMSCDATGVGRNCSQPASSLGTRWHALSQALTTFVQSPSNAGRGAGLGLFPRPTTKVDNACSNQCTTCACAQACGCLMAACCFDPTLPCLCDANHAILDLDMACTADAYVSPDVGIGLLPGHAPSIVAAIEATIPSGGTPTAASIEGALQYAKSWAASHIDRTVALVYATDGEPEGCQPRDNTVTNAARIARDAFAQSNMRTYVLGVGPSLTSLNQIAAAGGTEQAYLVGYGNDVQAEFAKALDSIRSKAVSCDYKIPTPKAGTLDYGFVNVQVKVADTSAGTLVKWVQSPDQCQPTTGGWFYDNHVDPNASPTMIQLCPTTCDELTNAPLGSLEVQIGCQRTEKDPVVK